MRRLVCAIFAFALAFLTGLSQLTSAADPKASPDGLWRPLLRNLTSDEAAQHRLPVNGALFTLDTEAIAQKLAATPAEEPALRHDKSGRFTADRARLPTTISLPLPNGTYATFAIEESPVVSPALAAKFPQIRTYFGRSVDDGSWTVRLDFNSKTNAFHAQIHSPSELYRIDPTGEEKTFVSFSKRSVNERQSPLKCEVEAEPEAGRPAGAARAAPVRTGLEYRYYRLAIACTGEYAKFHADRNPPPAGITADERYIKETAYNAIVTTINRVNGVYERELAVRLEIVGENDQLIFTDPNTDPFNNAEASALMGQSQLKIDELIGRNNYDIGHTLSTGAGGKAIVGCVCRPSTKAQGVTGTRSPVGDGFDVDFVAHEMGHQFAGNHTFNGVGGNCGDRGQRSPNHAFEPGSGSTIMGYAGICGDQDNLQSTSNDYFHSESLEEITRYISEGEGRFPFRTQPTGNTPPTVNAGDDCVIPHRTPFVLTATGSDADGDQISYCWEQRDLGPAANLLGIDDGQVPLFRSFPPVVDAKRVFPRISDVISGLTTPGERPVMTDRVLNFRVTVRDGIATSGDDIQVKVVTTAGPFAVRSPNSRVTLSRTVSVRWDTAETEKPPIGCQFVNILLSTDGGNTFPVTLALNTLNDGEQLVNLPSQRVSAARIKVEAVGNCFFDMSDADFVIEPSSEGLVTIAPADSEASLKELLRKFAAGDIDRILASRRGTATRAAEAIAAGRKLKYEIVDNLLEATERLSQSPDGNSVLILGDQLEVDEILAAAEEAPDRTKPNEPGGASRRETEPSQPVTSFPIYRFARAAEKKEPRAGRPTGSATPAPKPDSAKRPVMITKVPSLNDYTPTPGASAGGVNRPASSPPPQSKPDGANRPYVTTKVPSLNDYTPTPGASAGGVNRPASSPPPQSKPDGANRPYVTTKVPSLNDYTPTPGASAGGVNRRASSPPPQSKPDGANRPYVTTKVPSLNDYTPTPGAGRGEAGRPTSSDTPKGKSEPKPEAARRPFTTKVPSLEDYTPVPRPGSANPVVPP